MGRGAGLATPKFHFSGISIILYKQIFFLNKISSVHLEEMPSQKKKVTILCSREHGYAVSHWNVSITPK